MGMPIRKFMMSLLLALIALQVMMFWLGGTLVLLIKRRLCRDLRRWSTILLSVFGNALGVLAWIINYLLALIKSDVDVVIGMGIKRKIVSIRLVLL
jgi:uncharacterized membrane protein